MMKILKIPAGSYLRGLLIILIILIIFGLLCWFKSPIEEFTQQKKFQQYLRLPNSTQDRYPFQNQSIHTTREWNYPKYFFSPSAEISNNMMKGIMDKIVQSPFTNSSQWKEVPTLSFSFVKGVSGFTIPNEEYNQWLEWILYQINQQIIENQYVYRADKNIFRIENSEIIHARKSKSQPEIADVEPWNEITWLLQIYRPPKNYGFQLQITSQRIAKPSMNRSSETGGTPSSKNKYDYRIVNYYLKGNPLGEDFLLPKNDFQNELTLSRTYPETPYQASEGYLRNDTDNYPIYGSRKRMNKLLEKRQQQQTKGLRDQQYQCFSPDNDLVEAVSQEQCLSEWDLNYKPKKPGVWDRPCQKNNECPFFQANKNYPNNRGGCDKGFCELPLNMKRIGYHYYQLDDNLEPYCHCSDNTISNCCRSQKNLSSPDYAFLNDEEQRG